MHEQRACGEGECESRFGEGVEDLQIHVRRRFQDVALLLDVVVERDDQRRVCVVREVGRDVRRISGNVLDLRGDGPQYLQRLFHLFGSRVVGQPQLHHGPPHRLRGDVDDGGVRDLVVRIARDAPVVTQYPRAAHAHVDHGSLQPVHVDRVADAERLVRKDGECAEDVLHRVLRGQREGDAADAQRAPQRIDVDTHVAQGRYQTDDPDQDQNRPPDHRHHFHRMAVRPLSPVLLEQGRGETCEDPRYVQYDQYAVGVVYVLHQLVGIDQPVNGDPDAQQHHGEFQGRFEGVVDDVVHPVVRAGDKRLYDLPAQQGEQFYDDERPYYDEYGNDPCLDRISPNFIFQHFSIGFKLSVQFVIYVSSFAIRIFTMAHAARFFFLSGDSIFMPLETNLHDFEMKIWLRMRMIIHKSRKKAVCITVAGLLAGIAGGLVLYYVRDVVLGWCFVITAGFALLYGMGSLFDRRTYIVLTEYGITEPFAIREQIEWDAVLYADDFYFRGRYWVRLLLGRDYKPQLIRPAWFWRFDRLYESKGVKAVYIRTMGLEVDSMRLAALIRRMKEADMSERIGLLREFRSE